MSFTMRKYRKGTNNTPAQECRTSHFKRGWGRRGGNLAPLRNTGKIQKKKYPEKSHSRHRLCWKLMPPRFWSEKSLLSSTAPRVIVRRDPESCATVYAQSLVRTRDSLQPSVQSEYTSQNTSQNKSQKRIALALQAIFRHLLDWSSTKVRR